MELPDAWVVSFRTPASQETPMRARDLRAIAFCAVTTLAVLAVCFLATKNYLASVGLAAAYAAVVFTRPRMLRVFRRLRGDPDWSGYYKND
jgi:hypothetical protein